MKMMNKTGSVLSWLGFALVIVALAIALRFNEPTLVRIVLLVMLAVTGAGVMLSTVFTFASRAPGTSDTLALAACHALVDAYDRGQESGGSIDWSDVDDAHEIALQALGRQ